MVIHMILIEILLKVIWNETYWKILDCDLNTETI